MLPLASVTCHVTAVIPRGNTTGALFDGVKAKSQLSVAEATPIVTEQLPVIMSFGIVSIGGWLSITVIVCVTVVVLLAESVTIQVKIFSPSVNTKLGLSFSIEIIL